MAIADSEPKKGDVDVTSTGSSSSSKEMKKPRVPIKYSSLKDFSFSVSDVWDDRNICTFIECCHEHLDDLKSHNGSEENKVWEKIAKSGLEKSGSVNCFNVNYCLELAKCLKSFVSKNEKKMMDNEIFKLLYENVVDLLPYFAPVSSSRHRSRSKSVENSKSDKNDQQQTTNHLVIPPFGTTSESTQALRKVAKILNKYKIDEFVRTSSRNAIWKEVTANVEKDFGVLVNPRAFLEGYKRGVVQYVRAIPDPKDRARVFLQQVDDLLPYYDHITPRSMKKAEFLNPAGNTEREVVVEPKKRKEPEDENHDDSSSTKSKKRLNSGGESIADSGDIPLTTNTTTPLRTYLKKKTGSDDPKSKRSRCSDDSDESCSGALDFLDEWNNSSNDALVEQQEEKEPEEKELEKAPVENEPPTPMEEPSAPPAPKKRGRKPKDPNAPAPVLPKKVMPLRQGTRSKKDTKVDASLAEKTIPDIGASPPVSSSKQLVPATRALTYPSRKDNPPDGKDSGGPAKYKTGDKRKETAQFLVPSETLRRDPRESEDSEIEDVPLMGTNIRVHTSRGKVEQSKSHPVRGNMDPVVLLDKISMDGYVNSLSSSARTKPISRSIQTRGRRGESTEKNREPNSNRGPSHQEAAPLTVERRKPGRPKKRTRAVPQRTEPTPVVSNSSVELVRQPMRTPAHALDRNFIVREIENRPSTVQSRHLMPMSPPSTSISENLVSRSNPDLNPPEWFERFVMETRRHEMWKVHQLMKMQQELLDSECQKRGVLEKILTALSDRS